MKVNVYSIFQLTQSAITHMRALDRGKVINISSAAGKWESLNQLAYNTSKHAVEGTAKCIALENARHNVNVNMICSGIVETDIIRNAQRSLECTGITADQFRAMIEE